jgi:predicted nucleotidyltransferase
LTVGVESQEHEYETRVARVCSRLNAESARYVLVGATAMQLWGTTRATRDIDLLIEPTVENARRVLRALASLGFGLAAEHLAEDVATRAVTVIGDVPNVDILTRAWNVRWEPASRRATTFDVEGVVVPTASIEDLIESKRTGRLQDAADIEVLEEIRRLRGGQ